LITLEISSGHADVARANIANAGLSDRVEVIVGDAFESLRALDPESAPTFDLVFIDANKDGYPRYFREALRLTRPGGIIVADNVVRSGRVLDPAESGSDVAGIRGLIEIISRDPRIAATAIQTVGEKSYDGFLIARIAD
jgi:predicted O-methyltransferase YrrM